MSKGLTRRRALVGLSAAAIAPGLARSATSFRLGLTPVFLDNDALVIERLRDALSEGMGAPVDLVQRRTYQEITATLLDGTVDAAWICGYPFLQHQDRLSLLGAPVWQGQPLYQSYLIVSADDAAAGLADLRNGLHAFSDPNSNSGYLVTASDLVRIGETPESYFSRTIFTFGHRNVVRSVAGGLTRSGSVDGYVWETLASVEPELTGRTKVISRSEWLGFPPFAARTDRLGGEEVARFITVLQSLESTPTGREALDLLFLDRIIAARLSLFDGIAGRMAEVDRAG